MGQEMDDLKAAVAAETTIGDSVVALLTDISDRLRAAVSSGDMDAIKALSAELKVNQEKLAAAVLANTPAAKVEPPVVDPNAPQP